MDLLVELSRPLGLEVVALAHYLERKLGRKVDLATFETFRRSLTSPRYRDIAVNIQESIVSRKRRGKDTRGKMKTCIRQGSNEDSAA